MKYAKTVCRFFFGEKRRKEKAKKKKRRKERVSPVATGEEAYAASTCATFCKRWTKIYCKLIVILVRTS
jgi:hypothetical protein